MKRKFRHNGSPETCRINYSQVEHAFSTRFARLRGRIIGIGVFQPRARTSTVIGARISSYLDQSQSKRIASRESCAGSSLKIQTIGSAFIIRRFAFVSLDISSVERPFCVATLPERWGNAGETRWVGEIRAVRRREKYSRKGTGHGRVNCSRNARKICILR